MRTVVLIGVVVILLVLGKLFIFSKPVSNTPPKGKAAVGGGSLAVEVLVMARETVENEIFASGTVLPNEEVDLKAELSGRLVQLKIDEGAYVKKGQLIAKINDRDIRAQLQKVGHNQALAQKIEQRQKKLLHVEAINLQDYDQTATDINVLEAEKEVLQAELEKTEIRAPFSGRIGLKNISEGAYVAPGTSIATVVQRNPIKVEFAVPEKYAQEIKVGSLVKLSLEGDQAIYTAKIIALDPKIDESLRTLKVRALASNAQERIVPGMFVKVQVALAANQDALMVPTEAIVPVLKGKKVFVVKNGKAQEVLIKTGLRTDSKVEVLEGLQPGDSLITTGIIALKANTTVKVK
ncbi:membrane fusion protein (multidrug efflux system) [Dyadobacter jejuensis]|uniref:Membrane fusion protein (Multidrug efflux system) n=1 Tax=Dyadobacter jejuensis TaxID=1082580 RepID=A0A316BAM7_9BACT|nr:efflux RND transporter periplasmic adaptor subunit [Dyadobacter jejuensis]PWJ59597.1 membrane fusion protein (multidrug efflux system) [Dyadobacter jejuensis]